MMKERYKDDSLDISGAGEKVKALINEHLVDLGINPKIPPVELLSDDFLAHVNEHAKKAAARPKPAKWSTLSASIALYISMRDPAFYKKLSEKLERLIEQHRDRWDALSR